MKVRIFFFLTLSLILFNGQLGARPAFNIAEDRNRQSDDSLLNIDATKKWSVRIADSFISRYPADAIYDSLYQGKWTFGQGIVLEALHQLYLVSHNKKYLTYIKSNVDMFIGGDGSIRTYNYNDFNLENINTGRQLLFLYSVTKNKKYKTAADTLMKQLKNLPRTKTGGFWHKKIYPNQMWLEGTYMAGPFYSQYSRLFRGIENFDDIAHQFILLEEKTRDGKTGLLCHRWDENLKEKWADPNTGRSQNFWAGAMGWYAMALVDVLDYFPKNHPKRGELIKILNRLSNALMKVRDENCSLWYQLIDQGAGKGNYYEASAACMFGYAFAKGANKGYLSKKYLRFAKETFNGVITNLASVDKMGCVDLHQIYRGVESEGKSFSDGNYESYLSEPMRANDPKGFGPFILLALELEKANMLKRDKNFSARK